MAGMPDRPISPRRSEWEPPSPMPGGMRFSRWWALPEKMISTRRISVPTPIPQRSCRDHRIIASSRMGKLRQRNGRQLVVGSLPGPSARSVLGEQLSASLRESLIEQMAAINSEDEAAGWAHRNLPAKNTLTAADAKMVEERFQARLSTISNGVAPAEISDGLNCRPRALRVADTPSQSHVVADEAKRAATRVRSHKGSTRAKKQSRQDVQSVLWANRFACAIKTTGSSCCGSRAWYAAACRRIRITSPLLNRVHSDVE